jgi:putative nucleotidyltransferase with HDIG domain
MDHVPKIIVVDDEPHVLQALKRALNDFPGEVFTAMNAADALQVITSNQIDIAICDQRMPDLLGIDLLMRIKSVAPNTIRILMSAYSDIDVFVSAINEGHIYYFISKPWDNVELIRIIEKAAAYKQDYDEKETAYQNSLQNKKQWDFIVRRLQAKLEETSQKAVNGLLKVLEVKERELYEHSQRVAKYAAGIADKLGLSAEQKENIKYGALFHDIGKIAIRDEILYKTGKLDEVEYNQMKRHPEKGAEILRELGDMDVVAEIVAQHHERMDGNGYPQGMKEGQILLEARIIAVADVFDALLSDRVYRKGMEEDAVYEILHKEAGGHFDKTVVDALIGLRRENSGGK